MRRTGAVLTFLCLSMLTQACDTASRDRKHVLARLRATYGQEAIIRVAYRRDSTNLLVHLDAAAFAHMPDSLFDVVARQIARLALQTYTRSAQLDSLTISAVDSPGGMVVLMKRQRSLAASDLR